MKKLEQNDARKNSNGKRVILRVIFSNKGSLVPRPPPFFVLRFAFSIIHRSGRAWKTFRFRVLYWTQTEEKKTGEARERGYNKGLVALVYHTPLSFSIVRLSLIYITYRKEKGPGFSRSHKILRLPKSHSTLAIRVALKWPSVVARNLTRKLNLISKVSSEGESTGCHMCTSLAVASPQSLRLTQKCL